MKRRAPARQSREQAPLWISHYLQGMRHFKGDMDAWRAAQHAWCSTNGCYRPGTKTCREASPRGASCGHDQEEGQP